MAGCTDQQGNRFIVQGKGGIPDNPLESFRTRVLWEDKRNVDDLYLLEQLQQRQQENKFQGESNRQETVNQDQSSFQKLIPAQGWVINANGTITLTSRNIGRQLIKGNVNRDC